MKTSKNHNLFSYIVQARAIYSTLHKTTRKWLYLDMFDTAAYELARLVQIPRYVKYLQGENTQCIKYHNIHLQVWTFNNHIRCRRRKLKGEKKCVVCLCVFTLPVL